MESSRATPYLMIDGQTVGRNLARMADYAGEHGLNLRPHTKTHKSKRVAKMQLDAGAHGLTAAKVGEAEVMAEVCDDLLVAFPAVDLHRTHRLAKLALHKTVRVAVDSKIAADALADAARCSAATIGILVDLDVGLHRTGLQTVQESLLLAQHVDKTAGLRLDGLFCFPGHVRGTAEVQTPMIEAISKILAETLDVWDEHGLEPGIVSGGNTPSAFLSHLVEEYTEIRPGTYVYNDAKEMYAGHCSLEDCAARVITTVVSTAVPDQFIIDAGSKTLFSDVFAPDPNKGFGYVVEHPEAVITRLTEEHGHVAMPESSRRPQVGDLVTVIPNHVCPCVNLHDDVWWREEDGSLEKMRVDARGMVV